MTTTSNETDTRGPVRKYLDKVAEYNGRETSKGGGVVNDVLLAVLGILLIPVIVLWALVTTVVGFFN